MFFNGSVFSLARTISLSLNTSHSCLPWRRSHSTLLPLWLMRPNQKVQNFLSQVTTNHDSFLRILDRYPSWTIMENVTFESQKWLVPRARPIAASRVASSSLLHHDRLTLWMKEHPPAMSVLLLFLFFLRSFIIRLSLLLHVTQNRWMRRHYRVCNSYSNSCNTYEIFLTLSFSRSSSVITDIRID